MARLSTLVLLLCLLLGGRAEALSLGHLSFATDTYAMVEPPGRTLVPLRPVAQWLGLTVTAQGREVVATGAAGTVRGTLGSPTVKVDDKPVNAPPGIVERDGIAHVPVRVLSAMSGIGVADHALPGLRYLTIEAGNRVLRLFVSRLGPNDQRRVQTAGQDLELQMAHGVDSFFVPFSRHNSMFGAWCVSFVDLETGREDPGQAVLHIDPYPVRRGQGGWTAVSDGSVYHHLFALRTKEEATAVIRGLWRDSGGRREYYAESAGSHWMVSVYEVQGDHTPVVGVYKLSKWGHGSVYTAPNFGGDFSVHLWPLPIE